ncbi:uncharacterized protein EDB91DRAFT_439853 [Suillus paluster]|uniref:uncharacterized protein n=1 Tax=Suillus paluster TaxID=48578 RepID=UPI001B8675E4|nr:uncharacterized protein EDB91DRAFT_439853 [Suillus paluster]KAG1738889.1 hypothetical protein EDB91DRAFT_439853 [Suillus paluster]
MPVHPTSTNRYGYLGPVECNSVVFNRTTVVHIQLANCIWVDDLFCCLLLFAQLTDIELAVHQPNALLHLLRLSPHLSSLTIGLGSGLLKWALQPFTHTKLQSLRIAYVRDCLLPDLFNILSLPNLCVPVAHDVEMWPHGELKGLLARSNCPLESLIFGHGVTTTDERLNSERNALPSFLPLK